MEGTVSGARAVNVGDTLSSFSRTTDLENWNRYAAVNDEFVAIHMDDKAGAAAGYRGAFGMGNLQWAFLHNAVRDWLDGDGEIISISCQFRGPNLRGMTVTVNGVIREVVDSDRGVVVSIDLRTESETGEALAPGRATVLLDSVRSTDAQQ
jgi:acyl dehydratase